MDTDKNTTNIPSCDFLGKSLEAVSLLEYSWTMFTRTKLFYYVQKPTEIYLYSDDLSELTGVGWVFVKVLKKGCL